MATLAKVTQLNDALTDPELHNQAAEAIRALVGEVVLRVKDLLPEGYDDWWTALDWVRDGLVAGGMLREVEVSAVMPKVRPWAK